MKLTPSWMFFAIALSVPMLSFLFLWYVAATAEDPGEGVGWLGLILMPLAFVWFLAFAAIAVAVSGSGHPEGERPANAGPGRVLRRIGLLILGFVCLEYTYSVLTLYLDHPSTAIFSAPLLVLLGTATCASFYALWRDVRGLKLFG